MNAYAFAPKDMKMARAVFNWKIRELESAKNAAEHMVSG
jgi:hypothetical protein